MSLDSRAAFELILETNDKLVDVVAPDGVATDPSRTFTSEAFDYYIARHGLPTTANETRRMFEFAACLDRVTGRILRSWGFQTPS